MMLPIRSLPLRFVPVLLSCGLAACATTPSGPPPVAGAPRYMCPDGTSFTTSVDPATRATSLFLSGHAQQVLQPVPDPMGGIVEQNADYQLRQGVGDSTEFLTDRSSTVRQACTRGS